MNKKRALLIGASGITIVSLIASGGNKGVEADKAAKVSPPSCNVTVIDFKTETIESSRLPKDSKVPAVTGAKGESKICHQDGKEISNKVTKQPVSAVTLVGTTAIPSGYDGNFNVADVVRDYTEDQQLSNEYFGTYTAPVVQSAPVAPTTATASDVYYKNCTAARAAGAAPVYAGQPGYASHLDKDGDGVGCEK